MATASSPAACASASPSPVRATSRSKTFTTAVPTTPRNEAVPPAATVPATRPVLLAAGPSGTQAGRPRTRCGSATASPAANTPGSDVRIPASTTTDRSGRCRAPAWISSPVAGRMPTAMTTRSAGISLPSTTAARQPSGVLPRSTASSRAPSRSPVWRSSSAWASAAIGGSTVPSTRGSASTTSTSTPAQTSASAVSRPMYPAPTTTARRTVPLASRRRSAIASSRDRIVNTPRSSSPGTGGRTGSAPVVSTSAS